MTPRMVAYAIFGFAVMLALTGCDHPDAERTRAEMDKIRNSDYQADLCSAWTFEEDHETVLNNLVLDFEDNERFLPDRIVIISYLNTYC